MKKLIVVLIAVVSVSAACGSAATKSAPAGPRPAGTVAHYADAVAVLDALTAKGVPVTGITTDGKSGAGAASAAEGYIDGVFVQAATFATRADQARWLSFGGQVAKSLTGGGVPFAVGTGWAFDVEIGTPATQRTSLTMTVAHLLGGRVVIETA